ncbi:hypothetical protein CYFUS_001159 [Cystobacter fuscus]|uniref:Serine/threonine protein kinase n=1 Tax=Cystobacter fuscus TaxID=43 RepID=A0A250IVH5_9BACT|nr:hypothetical protein [Cystobacter fuscus]ATB35745.1 hypothetical protein CYFUS_001159 [Cystobacter fuscus]
MVPNKFALLGCALLLVMSSGCPGTATGGVALRPDGTPGPEKCPEESKKAMSYLRMFVGEGGWVQIDANQSSARTITLYDGPIESVLDENIGLLESPARLYGWVWTSGPQATLRYYEAQPMKGGAKIPICAVARLGFEQLRKRPESKPGTALLDSSSAFVFIVDDFR